jgi:hypothetical protein
MILLLDTYFKEFFQKNVQFILRNKPYKKGRFINFKISGCYISFIVQTEKKKDIFEIPFPFAINNKNNSVFFDYRLETLCEQDPVLLVNLKTTTRIKNSKFYNTTLTITPLK